MLNRRAALLLAAISFAVVACGSTGQDRPAATSSTGAASGHPSVQPVILATPSSVPSAATPRVQDDNDIEAIGFGIGGSDADCSIAKPLETFTSTDHIRMVASYWPSLQAGTVVTFSLTREGSLIDGYPVTTTLDVATKCVHGNISNGHLVAGHYRLDVAPDTARAISAEFDVR